MVSFLEDESIFDDQRLPSYTAFPIIAAIWEYLPTHPDQLGNARWRRRVDRHEAVEHGRSKTRNQPWIDFLRSTPT